tara:strand:+ start:190 stop:456 length:267 start_codon:yes stop_codon:yes gene_type:complete
MDLRDFDAGEVTMKKSEEYTRKIGRLLSTIGSLSLQTTEKLVEMSRLAKENNDDFLTERLNEALDIKKQFDETMVKIIDNLVRREDMR